MNVRKPIDYSTMFSALDILMAAELPQMELYQEIGKLVSARLEKGAAVAAAGYIAKTYPDASGFSPRNLRRMREFYRAYENTPEVLAEAMTISWTQNIVILENCEIAEDRRWYITAVRRSHWTKTELLTKISEGINRSETLTLSSIEDAEDKHTLYNIDVSCVVTSETRLQTDSSRLAGADMIYWAKRKFQDWRKDGTEDTGIQDLCYDRPCSAGSVQEHPRLTEMGLLPPVECLPAPYRVRPCLPSLRPPANEESCPATPSCTGYDAGRCGESSLYRGCEAGYHCGPGLGYGAASPPDQQEQTVPIPKVHGAEIEEYLAMLDLIMDSPIQPPHWAMRCVLPSSSQECVFVRRGPVFTERASFYPASGGQNSL